MNGHFDVNNIEDYFTFMKVSGATSISFGSKTVKGENSMKKVSCWEDLVDAKLATIRGLSAEVKKADKQAVINIYLVEKATTPIAVIDWMPTLKDVVDILRKFGFDVEYEEPFNLVEFLKNNIKPKIFIFGKTNFCFIVEKYERIKIVGVKEYDLLDCKYFNIEMNNVSFVEETLKNNEITPVQLTRAMKELEWI